MRAWLYIITTGMVFGVGGPATKFLIDRGLDPVFLTGVIFTVTAIACVPIHLRVGNNTGRAWREAMLIGVFNAILPALFFNLGFSRLPVSINTVLISLGPVFTSVGAHFLAADDRFTSRKAAGLSMSLGGVALLAGLAPGGPISPMGLLYTISGSIIQGVSYLWVRKLAVKYRPLSTLAPMLAGAALAGLAAIPLVGEWASPNGVEWIWIVCLGVSNVLAFGSVLAANEIAPASQTSLFAYVIPVIGMLIGVTVFDEPFGLSLVLGAALVLAGLVLVGSRKQAAVLTEVGSLDRP